MFIKRTKMKRGDKVYPCIALVEGYRENGKVKHRTIANLTKWDPAMIEGLEKVLKGGKVNNFDELNLESGKAFGALYVLDKLAEEIGIKKSLGKSENAKLALVMILGRILNQGSRLGLVSWQNDQAINEIIGINKFDEDQLYNAMDWLNENQEVIEKNLWKHRYESKTPELFLYDVTSSYLEGNKNELAEYGYNRDGKKYKKQIVIGLLTDDEGIPVAVRVFKGNTPDTQTVETQINTLAEQFGVKNLTFVGDRGMIKSDQKTKLEIKEWYWITATTKPQIETLIKRETIQLSLFEENLCEVIEDNIRYILRKNPVRAKEISDNRKSKVEKLTKKIEDSNNYLTQHPKAKIETQIKNLNGYITSRNLSGYIALEEKGRIISIIKNENELKENEKLDGCYVIQTNLPKENLSAEKVHARYKDLAEIENHFRNFKTTSLEIRPIYHRKAERTQALVFITMLARMITMVFEKKTSSLNYSLDYMIKTLDRIQYNFLDIKGIKTKIIPKILDDFKIAILNSLNIRLPNML